METYNTGDLSFITNEEGQTLTQRFNTLIKDTRFFDCIVGYFYISGFFRLYKSLENAEKIRILIGIGINRETFDLIESANNPENFPISHSETKVELEKGIVQELENAEDSYEVEIGIKKFIEWIRSKKLEIRAYPTRRLHAKVYIMTFKEGDRDAGRIITGSSNFTQAGLENNLEFNVELKNRADYEFAKRKFEELWQNAVEVSEKYVETVNKKTWLRDDITPYELYLKFLYEYFKDELNQPEDLFVTYYPTNFKKLEYQEQAVLNAKKILEEYGGVFISDVVGLGKTYITAMLVNQLDGRTLVIAPPVLLDKNNPGSWPNVFSDFKVHADFESIGKLDHILKRGVEKYKNIVIDEAHRFRSENTKTYEKLAQICRGKRVILVTATPYNNSPKDILSQIKLFQNTKRSTIPNLPDLESFFSRLEKRLKNINREQDYEKYLEVVRKNAKEIREKVLKYLMVRRTRSEIEKYFTQDLKKQNITFPEVENPQPLYYQFNEVEDAIFDKTIRLIATEFSYARYMPLLYFKGKISQLEKQSQRNMGTFMKILLVKRLESSFFAFRNSINRFIRSYEMFIESFKKGKIYISKKYSQKIFDYLERGDDEAILKLIEEGKAEEYSSAQFSDTLLKDLEKDLQILYAIENMWKSIKRDPKLEKFIEELSTNDILKTSKLIVFTESKETAEYLTEQINEKFSNIALCFTGSVSEAVRDKVIENFDARARHPKDEYRILVSTDVLSEGINLHRSNVVINYDIPWNPTRIMQRVGRVNRIDTKFNKIYIFNFFPTKQSNNQIKLKEIAEAKINAFLTLLGGDAAILTEGEPVGSHELFNRLLSKKTVTGEDDLEESELKYLQIIKEIRDKQPDLFAKIKNLPKKARTAKVYTNRENNLLTYFRKGKIQKFFICSLDSEPEELDFMSAAEILESSVNEEKKSIPDKYYELLDKNKQAFEFATTEELQLGEPKKKGKNNIQELIGILKATQKNSKQLTEDQEAYIKKVIERLEKGGLPKQTIKKTLKALKDLKYEITNPLKVVATLQVHIPSSLLKSHFVEETSPFWGKREVILSLYLAEE